MFSMSRKFATSSSKKNHWRYKLGEVLFDPVLMPFYFGLFVYFSLYEPYLSYPPWSLVACFFKSLPVMCLAGFVYYKNAPSSKWPPSLKDLHLPDNLAGYFIEGLLFSCLGDACLVFRTALFLPGMIFFALAHVLYTVGLKERCKAVMRGETLDNPTTQDTSGSSEVTGDVQGVEEVTASNGAVKVLSTQVTGRYRSLYGMGAAAVFLMLTPGIDSSIMLVAVFVYTVVIFSFAWMALQRWAVEGSASSRWGLAGSLLFLLSDFIIALDKWRLSLPLAELVVMTTYYAAQLCLAISTTRLP